jgi:hypothetical protein
MPQPDPVVRSDADSERPSTGRLRRYYRMFRWASLIVFLCAALLALRDSSPPQVETSPEAVKQAEAKIRQFSSNIQRGREDALLLDQSELNGWLRTGLAIPQPSSSEYSGTHQEAEPPEALYTGLEGSEPSAEEIERAKSSIRDLQVELRDDAVRLYALFEAYGVDLSLEIEARLHVDGGYLRLEPLGGRLGSLPVPAGALKKAVDRMFESPENREKFRLPDHIRDIRIDRGQLIVSAQ